MENKEIREQFLLLNNNQKIFGVLQRPDVTEKVPAVLYCHGLAGHKVGNHRMYVLLGEQLAKLGIASFRIDFRGSGDSEGNFADMTMESEVSDALVALNFMEKHPNVDPDRIGIFGRSFGGAIAVMAAHRFNKIKSIALWAPIFNASQWEQKWKVFEANKLDKIESQKLMTFNGQLPSLNFYKELFKMNLENDLRTLDNVPMLDIHGVNDPIISVDHVALYENIRKDSAAKSKFVKLPHSDHDFHHPEEKKEALKLTADWFVETLK